VEVKSIRAANIKKTYEKLKAQIENRKNVDVDKDFINISINAANRVFGELMESSIKKSLSIKPAGSKSGFTRNERKPFRHYGDRAGLGAKAGRYGGTLEMNNIMNMISETPDMRVNIANDILMKIKEGTYKADYLIIAEKLLSHDLVMRI
jgi:hypothetical protein